MDEEEMFALNLRAERERRRQQLQHAEYVKAFGRIIDEYVERVGGELGVPREVFEREARKEFELALDRGFGAYYFLYVPLPSDKPVAASSGRMRPRLKIVEDARRVLRSLRRKEAR